MNAPMIKILIKKNSVLMDCVQKCYHALPIPNITVNNTSTSNPENEGSAPIYII